MHMDGDVPVPLCPSPMKMGHNGTGTQWNCDVIRTALVDDTVTVVVSTSCRRISWNPFSEGMIRCHVDKWKLPGPSYAGLWEALCRGLYMTAYGKHYAGAVIWRPIGSTMPGPSYDGLWEALCRGRHMTSNEKHFAGAIL